MDNNLKNNSTMVNNNVHQTEEILEKANNWRWKLDNNFHDHLSEAIYGEAKRIADNVVTFGDEHRNMRYDHKLDRIVTSKKWGYPIMVGMLAIVLWITIIGSNYPSEFLSNTLVGMLYPWLKNVCSTFLPPLLVGFFIDGIYLTTAWVVSVMLPPMAIFFPLFTLLEDYGYLPRVAFNLDEIFRRNGAHGKQALTMAMGFGCNAAGVVATRIIDSPRERLIAIITNNFSLCNGRWPLQIMLATIFIGAVVPAKIAPVVSFAAVLAVALLGVGFTFLSSRLLSKTMLKGEVSTFSLELPPYRPPKILQTLYTSLIDRTLIVLWRAIVFAVPAGALIWLLCNINISGTPIAEWLIHGLDGIGWIMGLNGVILLAYIIAVPANEIVIPTILMLTVLMVPDLSAFSEGTGVMISDDEINTTRMVLETGGWTLLTAVNVMLFSLLHNPCSTTLYTIYKETGSAKWTTVSALMPIAMGFIVTTLVATIWRIFI